MKPNEVIKVIEKYRDQMEPEDVAVLEEMLEEVEYFHTGVVVWHYVKSPATIRADIAKKTEGTYIHPLYVAYVPAGSVPFWWLESNSPFAPDLTIIYNDYYIGCKDDTRKSPRREDRKYF